MKKIMLISALMLSASLMADNEKYEVTPVIGYNLVEKGVAEDRIASEGMGEESLVADNSTKEGRAKNRRIEASLVKN